MIELICAPIDHFNVHKAVEQSPRGGRAKNTKLSTNKIYSKCQKNPWYYIAFYNKREHTNFFNKNILVLFINKMR